MHFRHLLWELFHCRFEYSCELSITPISRLLKCFKVNKCVNFVKFNILIE